MQGLRIQLQEFYTGFSNMSKARLTGKNKQFSPKPRTLMGYRALPHCKKHSFSLLPKKERLICCHFFGKTEIQTV